MKCLRFLTVATLLALAWRPALAADATFPPGLRVGLAPLVGLSRAKTFSGFQSEDESVKVLMTELPAEAYGEVSSAFKANPAGAGGIKPEKIETSAGTAYYTVESAREGANAVRGHGGSRGVVPYDGGLLLHQPAAEQWADRAARRFRDPDACRLLPALRRCDGADAALSRRARTCRGRVLERNL